MSAIAPPNPERPVAAYVFKIGYATGHDSEILAKEMVAAIRHSHEPVNLLTQDINSETPHGLEVPPMPPKRSYTIKGVYRGIGRGMPREFGI